MGILVKQLVLKTSNKFVLPLIYWLYSTYLLILTMQ